MAEIKIVIEVVVKDSRSFKKKKKSAEEENEKKTELKGYEKDMER